MDTARDALPDDITALKEALIIERDKGLEVAAELAVARAKASEDVALIAQQKLRIAKLERQVYGQRSERSARLIDQLALEFEELEAGATEAELAAELEQRAARRGDVGAGLHEPLIGRGALGRVLGQQLARLLGQVNQDRSGVEQRQRLTTRTVGIDDGRDLAVGIEGAKLS